MVALGTITELVINSVSIENSLLVSAIFSTVSLPPATSNLSAERLSTQRAAAVCVKALYSSHIISTGGAIGL